jgi:hypothetical protein
VTETRDAVDALVQRLLDPPSTIAEEEQRDAAERLHVLGTDDALRRLTGPRAAYARALLRDTRWNVPGAGPVPLIGESGGLAAAVALIRLRLRRASRVLAARSVTAAIGGGAAGIAGGTVGGLLLSAAPGSEAPAALAAVLAIVGGCCGALGGAGVGAGLSIGEAIARSRRLLVLAAGAAFGGGVVGESTGWLARVALASIVGVHVAIGGGVQGLVLGGAAGFGYALATRYAEAGLAAPRGRLRLRAAALTALACALAAVALTAVGLPLVGGTIHTIAVASAGSQAVLTPIGRLIGEPDFGAAARALIAMGEAALFGFGLALGLTRRPPTPGDAA